MNPRDDSGVTLVEVLVATMIGGLISGVIAAAFAVGVRTTDTSNQRLAGSQGAQITTAFFPRDVQSSLTISLGATPCSGGTPTVATLSWTDVDAAGTSVAKQAQYTCRTTGAQVDLIRRYLENAVFRSDVVLVHGVIAASVSCSPDCTTPRAATITATEVGGFTFAVTGSRRVA